MGQQTQRRQDRDNSGVTSTDDLQAKGSMSAFDLLMLKGIPLRDETQKHNPV